MVIPGDLPLLSEIWQTYMEYRRELDLMISLCYGPKAVNLIDLVECTGDHLYKPNSMLTSSPPTLLLSGTVPVGLCQVIFLNAYWLYV